MVRGGGYGSCGLRKELVITAFSFVDSIFVVRPNKRILYDVIESDNEIVDVTSNFGRKNGVKHVYFIVFKLLLYISILQKK